MAFFKRKKQNTDVLPAEVREYYQSERRERAGVAWLLALGTLLLTFVIAAALFFGGRWLYNTIFNNDNNDSDTKQTTSQDSSLRVDENGNVTGGNNQNATNGSTGTSSTSTNTPSAPATTPNTATTPTTTPNTGDLTPASLVDTGPGDEE